MVLHILDANVYNNNLKWLMSVSENIWENKIIASNIIWNGMAQAGIQYSSDIMWSVGIFCAKNTYKLDMFIIRYKIQLLWYDKL
jgi:hypothetical protein